MIDAWFYEENTIVSIHKYFKVVSANYITLLCVSSATELKLCLQDRKPSSKEYMGYILLQCSLTPKSAQEKEVLLHAVIMTLRMGVCVLYMRHLCLVGMQTKDRSLLWFQRFVISCLKVWYDWNIVRRDKGPTVLRLSWFNQEIIVILSSYCPRLLRKRLVIKSHSSVFLSICDYTSQFFFIFRPYLLNGKRWDFHIWHVHFLYRDLIHHTMFFLPCDHDLEVWTTFQKLSPWP